MVFLATTRNSRTHTYHLQPPKSAHACVETLPSPGVGGDPARQEVRRTQRSRVDECDKLPDSGCPAEYQRFFQVHRHVCIYFVCTDTEHIYRTEEPPSPAAFVLLEAKTCGMGKTRCAYRKQPISRPYSQRCASRSHRGRTCCERKAVQQPLNTQRMACRFSLGGTEVNYVARQMSVLQAPLLAIFAPLRSIQGGLFFLSLGPLASLRITAGLVCVWSNLPEKSPTPPLLPFQCDSLVSQIDFDRVFCC